MRAPVSFFRPFAGAALRLENCLPSRTTLMLGRFGSRLIVVVVLALATAQPVSAHDLWIEPTTFISEIGSVVGASGNDIEFNESAAGSGADWKYTLRRPSTGMGEARVVVLPAGNPAIGQALQVASYSGGVVTLDYLTVAAGNDKTVVDTTSLAFGTTSPLSMFTLPANAVVMMVKVIIDTSFNNTPSLSVGVAGTTSKYLGTGDVDLTASAGTVFEIAPGLPANGSTEALIATYSAGGASAGAARILVEYVIPS